ncbi:hypothetical protein BD769DRAFT_1391387 [Suillus cothurnatus]|nr:hypothetical protein BD769DRAFT_1391387 [Suillus cothurnatus]
MPFELIKHIFKIFYPDERGHSNHPDQLLGVGSLVPCYDRSGHSAVTCFSDNSDATSADELSSVVAPSRSAEEEIAPVKCHPSLPAEELTASLRLVSAKRIAIS